MIIGAYMLTWGNIVASMRYNPHPPVNNWFTFVATWDSNRVNTAEFIHSSMDR